jgi:HTH-type transcriptional regulator/antitoxin HigA
MSDVKPIRTEADYDAALGEVERLWGAKSGTPKGDRLDVLATLIDVYENEHYPMDPPDPIEAIKAIKAIKLRMEQQNLTRKDLEGIIGSRTRIAEILNRRRGLSVNMIRRLHEKLGISADVLIRPSQITSRTKRAA